jgi:hypothetical protein
VRRGAPQASANAGVAPRDMTEPAFLAAVTEREVARRWQEAL